MKAILLAAGVGSRLKNAFDGKPKCLLEIGGKTLLSRHLLTLAACRVQELMVVTGYQSNLISSELELSNSSLHISTIFNPDYRAGSVVSLSSAGEFLSSGSTTLLMDADVLYDDRILSRLVNSPHPNCFLLDRDFETGDEPVKLCVSAGKLVEFRKQIHEEVIYDYQGESVGFFKFAPGMAEKLAERTRLYINQGRQNEPYEEVIRDLLLECPDDFSYEDITGMPWLEIDFPEDITRASRDVLPKIERVGI